MMLQSSARGFSLSPSAPIASPVPEKGAPLSQHTHTRLDREQQKQRETRAELGGAAGTYRRGFSGRCSRLVTQIQGNSRVEPLSCRGRESGRRRVPGQCDGCGVSTAVPAPRVGNRRTSRLTSDQIGSSSLVPSLPPSLRLNSAAEGAARAAPAGMGRVGPVPPPPGPGPVPPAVPPAAPAGLQHRQIPAEAKAPPGAAPERAIGQESPPRPSRFIYHAPSVSFRGGREEGWRREEGCPPALGLAREPGTRRE